MDTLKDKVTIVTGASSGIGAGIVKELLQSGMKVVGLARRKAKVEEIGKNYEGKLFAIETDVTIVEDVVNAFSWTEENVGPVYVLVNNAGVSYMSPIDEANVEKFKQVLNTNILALTVCTKEAVKSMKANKIEGFIINISSVFGHYQAAFPGVSIYTTSKFGVTAFSESIRRELATAGSKIKITNLSPGLVESEMSQGALHMFPYLKSEDIASGVKYIITQPPDVNVAELTLRPVAETH